MRVSLALIALHLLALYSLAMSKPLKNYLRQAASLARRTEKVGSRVAVVLGNEAADADSIVSSLTYAYYKHAHQGCQTIPVVGIKRSEIHLRRDVELLLQRVELQLDDLICWDECNTATLYENDELDLVLVDHNHLAPVAAQDIAVRGTLRAGLVTEILDHHKDMGENTLASVRDIAFDEVRSVATVASTCTLVAERYLGLSASSLFDADVATLLLGVIALDTLNMDPAADRGTPRDLATMLAIEERHSGLDRPGLFNTLKNAKTDQRFWESLSTSDALRLDFKAFKPAPDKSFGMSAVLQPVHTFMTKPDLVPTIQSYFAENPRDDMLVVMTFLSEPELMREIVLFFKDDALAESVADFLATKGSHMKLELYTDLANVQELSTSPPSSIRTLGYRQGNLSMSRKQVAPLLLEYYSAAGPTNGK
jgi:exopolyphosphatase